VSNWYCIRTATRQEFKVVDGLDELSRAHGIELVRYLPCETRWNRLTRVKTPKPVLPPVSGPVDATGITQLMRERMARDA
jgi:hypothetical protein